GLLLGGIGQPLRSLRLCGDAAESGEQPRHSRSDCCLHLVLLEAERGGDAGDCVGGEKLHDERDEIGSHWVSSSLLLFREQTCPPGSKLFATEHRDAHAALEASRAVITNR